MKKTVRRKRWAFRALIAAILLFSVSIGFTKKHNEAPALLTGAAAAVNSAAINRAMLYDKLGLEAMGLSREAYTYALSGFNNLLNAGKIQKDNILSILDFSLPSGKKRLFVIDLAQEELVINTYASHGKNSGKEIATDFSNQTNSNKSSLGFYITGATYIGKHGCSLRLEGEENGINDNAASRGIVMHSAAYVNEKVAQRQGFIGRSQGCPAIPEEVSKKIINTIKNGSCLFIYSPNTYYATHSKMIQDAA